MEIKFGKSYKNQISHIFNSIQPTCPTCTRLNEEHYWTLNSSKYTQVAPVFTQGVQIKPAHNFSLVRCISISMCLV